jgi:hypothetical protein
MRVASDRPSTGKAGGWLHKLAAPATGQTIQHKKPTPKLNPAQLELLNRRYQTAINPPRLGLMATIMDRPARRYRRPACPVVRNSSETFSAGLWWGLPRPFA